MLMKLALFLLLVFTVACSKPDDSAKQANQRPSTPSVIFQSDPDATQKVVLVGTTNLPSGSVAEVHSRDCKSPVVRLWAEEAGGATKYFDHATSPRYLSMRIPEDLPLGAYKMTVLCDEDYDVSGPAHTLGVHVVEPPPRAEQGVSSDDDAEPNQVCFEQLGGVDKITCEERERYPSRVWWMNDDAHGPAIVKADVLEALRSLSAPQLVWVSRVETLSVPDLYPDETFLFFDEMIFDPDSGLRWVYTFHTDLGNRILEDLPTLVQSARASDQEASSLTDYLSAALATFSPGYVVDGPTIWLSAYAHADYERLRFETAALLHSSEDLTPQAQLETAALQAALPEPRDWWGRWIALELSDPQWDYPEAMDSTPMPIDVAVALADAGLVVAEITDGLVQDVRFNSDVVLTQVERDEYYAEIELSVVDTNDPVATLLIQTDTNQIASLKVGTLELRLEWRVDLSYVDFPDKSKVLTIAETASWLGIAAECLRPGDTVMSIPDPLPQGCEN